MDISKLKKFDADTMGKLIVGFFVNANIPFRAIKNPFFMAMLEYAAPWYKPFCRRTLVSKINDAYGEGAVMLGAELKDKPLSITMDLATVLNSTRQFLVVSGHFIDFEQNCIASRTLGVRQMMIRSDHKSVIARVKDVFKCLDNLSLDNIKTISTDGAKNMKKASTEFFGPPEDHPVENQPKHINCVCHILNLIVSHSFDKCADIKDLVQIVKATVSFFKMSTTACNLLRDFQTTKRKYTLKQSIDTRWNSELVCLKRYVKLKPIVDQVLEDKRVKSRTSPSPLTNDELKTIALIMKVLEPLDFLTKTFSSSKKPTCSAVVIKFQKTFDYIMGLTLVDVHANKFKTAITEEFGVKLQELKNNEHFACANLLDPRLKGIHVTKSVKEACIKKLKSQLFKAPGRDAEDLGSPSKRPRLDDLHAGLPMSWLEMRRIALQVRERQVCTASSIITSDNELDKFLAEDVTQDDQVQYWIRNQKKYPKLSSIALEFLLIPASSVSSERIVSNLGHVLQDKRSCLLSSNVNSLVSLRALPLHMWCKIIGVTLKKLKK